MNPSMINAMTSMSGLQQKLDILANNIANMDTIGYKRQDASFADILTNYKQQQPIKDLPGRVTPLGLTIGWGSKLSMQQTDFTQGSLRPTDLPTDLAIEGNGLFEIGIPWRDNEGELLIEADGSIRMGLAWTRNGAFQLTTQPGDDEHAYLATQEGHLLRGMMGEHIRIPHTHRMTIDANGNVYTRDERDASAAPELVDQLRIVNVLRPQVLESIGNGLFRLADDIELVDSVVELVDNPEEAGIAIRQGFLEQSNVNLANEMTELINIQRAYQLNARALSSSDMMMNLANQLRG